MNSIQTIDCHYYTNEFAAAYLMREGEEGLFVDNNTNSAIPYLLNALSARNISKEKVKIIAVQWLKRTPTIKVTDNTRLILIDILKGNYKRNAIQSWQEAALLLGLNEYQKSTNDAAVNASINSFVASKLSSDGHWIVKPTEVDSVILGYAFLKLDAFKNWV